MAVRLRQVFICGNPGEPLQSLRFDESCKLSRNIQLKFIIRSFQTRMGLDPKHRIVMDMFHGLGKSVDVPLLEHLVLLYTVGTSP